MYEALKQTGINALVFLLFPAAYGLVGYVIQHRWPNASHQAYWLTGGIVTATLYVGSVLFTFALCAFLAHDTRTSAQTLFDS